MLAHFRPPALLRIVVSAPETAIKADLPSAQRSGKAYSRTYAANCRATAHASEPSVGPWPRRRSAFCILHAASRLSHLCLYGTASVILGMSSGVTPLCIPCASVVPASAAVLPTRPRSGFGFRISFGVRHSEFGFAPLRAAPPLRVWREQPHRCLGCDPPNHSFAAGCG
jgi:hypothetical protein